jgi:hypothetical protein
VQERRPLGLAMSPPPHPSGFCPQDALGRAVGHESDAQEWTGNYSSAVDNPEVMATTFAEQVDMHFMIRMSYEEARARYGARLRVAAMGALEQSNGEFRMIHDGTHGAQVNAAIRVRDQEGCPAAHDLVAALDHEIAQGTPQLFALALDISKAHRRVPVDPRDWGLQACSDLPRRRAPGPQDAVWVNTVGTYGLGSASYWWARVGALLLRITHYVVTPAGLRWALRFADDYFLVSGGTQMWRPLLISLLLLRSLEVPLKWSKLRGGFQVDWIGYNFDLVGRTAGVSPSRARWATGWCTRMAGLRTIPMEDFREVLGRLAFAAALLVFVKPFLGPLYAWVACAAPGSAMEVTPLVRSVLGWVAQQFALDQRVRFGRPVVHQGERFRADAKAQGQDIVIGGWEVGGVEGTQHSRWYSLRLTREDVPWAYTRGDPFRSIASLELLATLVCVLVFGPTAQDLEGASIGLTASGDNQSNGFTLDRLSSTKYPLYLVLMELSEQLRRRNLLLSVAWRPRDENEEADALTNEVFAAFDARLRIPVRWRDLDFAVLPGLTESAEAHFHVLQQARAAARKGPRIPSPPTRRVRLREREPW